MLYICVALCATSSKLLINKAWVQVEETFMTINLTWTITFWIHLPFSIETKLTKISRKNANISDQDVDHHNPDHLCTFCNIFIICFRFNFLIGWKVNHCTKIYHIFRSGALCNFTGNIKWYLSHAALVICFTYFSWEWVVGAVSIDAYISISLFLSWVWLAICIYICMLSLSAFYFLYMQLSV